MTRKFGCKTLYLAFSPPCIRIEGETLSKVQLGLQPSDREGSIHEGSEDIFLLLQKDDRKDPTMNHRKGQPSMPGMFFHLSVCTA